MPAVIGNVAVGAAAAATADKAAQALLLLP